MLGLHVPIELIDPRAYLERYRFWSRAKNGRANGKSTTIAFPEVHSFLEAPEAALEASEEMVLHVLDGCEAVHLDRTRSTRVDVCAESVTTVLAQQLAQLNVHLTHAAPTDPFAAAACDAFSVPPVSRNGTSPGRMERLFREEDRISVRVALQETQIWLKEQLTTERLQPSPDLIKAFGSFMGEAVHNGLDHGAGDCWLSTAVRKDLPDSLPRVELAIFNLGDTLDETIMEMPEHEPARQDINKLQSLHQKAGYFVDGWTNEALLVRHALQHRITKDGANERTGGVGTMKMISCFELLVKTSRELPRCALLTGATHVRLSPRYTLERKRGSRRRPAPIRNIAFNDQNDFRLPADRECFQTLTRRFPGTLVTLQFTLAPDHLIPREVAR